VRNFFNFENLEEEEILSYMIFNDNMKYGPDFNEMMQ